MSTRTAGPTFFPPLGPAKVSGGITPRGWDRAVIAGQVLPAHATISKGGIKLKQDPKKKAGSDGCRPVYHGVDPQPLQLELETYSDDDRETLAGILATMIPVPDRQPKPLSFDHPSVRHLGISTVMIVGVGPFMPVKPGVAKVSVDFMHWLPPKSPTKVATFSPSQAVRNLRKEAADKANPPNPAPTARAGFGGPPAFTGAKK